MIGPTGPTEQLVDGHPEHFGGGFNPPEPTSRGPGYGKFIEAVRTLQDHARAADAPDDVITRAAELIGGVSQLLAPHWADEWASPSSRHNDLPGNGNLLHVPTRLSTVGDRIRGVAQFRRYHLGRNGAVHGGALGLLFDSVLAHAAAELGHNRAQRTAFLHINYRKIVPIDKQLELEAKLQHIDGRKIFVEARLNDDGTLLTDAHALFVRLRPGQP
jgi:acyl-coenzyme A thioesterase PaaI-like protein